MTARLEHTVGRHLHTDVMTHELVWSMLAANELNATLAGPTLRDAATDLVHAVRTANATGGMPVTVWPIDAAGERIVGAALMLEPELTTYDHTRAWPNGNTCFLVCGAVVGDVSLVGATKRARSAGATRVNAAVLHGWTGAVPGLDTITGLSHTEAQVA
jgi:hypothetical protein